MTIYSVIMIISIILSFVSLKTYTLDKQYKSKEELGIKLVKLLYDFNSVEELDAQMTGVKAITTEPVFNQLTIDNEGRTLNTYLKFKNRPVHTKIIKSTDSYVLYRLDTDEVAESRLFIFMFDVKDNKVSYVREVEAIDFVTTIY